MNFSIIINNYNYDRFLSQAIDSALAQTYPHLEVIVVDDGSTDESREIISRYGNSIRAILKENGGQASAMNAGFIASRGDIILFLDSDDYLSPDASQNVAKIWHEGLSKVHFRLNAVDENNALIDRSYPQGGSLSTGELHLCLLEGKGYSTVPTSGNAISRKALSKIMPIPEEEFRISADNYLTTLVPFYGVIESIEKPLGFYRIHGNNGWFSSGNDISKYYKFVDHDIKRDALIKAKAKDLEYTISPSFEIRFFGRFWSRIASLRLNPEKHPISTDRSFVLTLKGIYSIWIHSGMSLKKKIAFSLWFTWSGLMPIALARPAIVWLFAPHLRPKFIQVFSSIKRETI